MSPTPLLGKRIYICGTSGSGKSTLARALADRRRLIHTEIDSLYHMPNWQTRPTDEFRSAVEEILRQDDWILDGNYSAVKAQVIEACDTLIWLDYPKAIVMRRVLERTLRRLARREILWNGNREPFFRTFFTRDSIIRWAWITHEKRRRDADETFALLAGSNKSLLRFYRPEETERWLEAIPAVREGRALE